MPGLPASMTLAATASRPAEGRAPSPSSGRMRSTSTSSWQFLSERDTVLPGVCQSSSTAVRTTETGPNFPSALSSDSFTLARSRTPSNEADGAAPCADDERTSLTVSQPRFGFSAASSIKAPALVSSGSRAESITRTVPAFSERSMAQDSLDASPTSTLTV